MYRGEIKSNVPSRTSRSYACQYHRTCRLNLLLCELVTPRSRGSEGRLTSGGCRLAGVDMADDDDVDMSLFLTEGSR